MKLRWQARILAGGVLGVGVVASMAWSVAGAQAGTGTVTGTVAWPACIAVPQGAPGAVPGAPPDNAGSPAPDTTAPSGSATAGPADQSGAQPSTVYPVPGPGIVPAPSRPIPAGAVLVAVQDTTINTRTDETGKFTLGSVPSGQYWVVAAGPVQETRAWSLQPNVQVGAGQTMDLGTMVLGTPAYPLACRGPVPFPAAPQSQGS